MNDLDLNNLIPDPVKVKIGDDQLDLQPPTLRALFAINKLVTKLTAGDTSSDEADNLANELKAELDKICPGLEKHQLNGNQLLALAGMVAEMSQPKSTAKKEGEVKPDPKVTTQ